MQQIVNHSYSIEQYVPNVIYTWRFTCTSHIDELIVNGYYRQYHNKPKIKSVIEVIKFYLQYNNTLIHEHTLNHIKNAQSDKDYFESPIFMNETHPLYMSIHPINDSNHLQVKIHLAAFPDAVDELAFNFKLYIKELGAKSLKAVTFKDNTNERHDTFEFNEISLDNIKHLNQLTLHLINDENNKCTTQFPTITYKWHVPYRFITALDTNDYFESHQFAYNSLLKLSKSGSEVDGEYPGLYLYLASLPLEMNEILIRYRVWIGNSRCQYNVTGCLSFEKEILKHRLGDRVIQDEVVIYVELCMYTAYKPNKIIATQYINDLIKSKQNVKEIKQYYHEFYSWKISLVSFPNAHNTDLICYGYYRQFCRNNHISGNIINTIITQTKLFLELTNNSFDSAVLMKGKLKLYMKVTLDLNGKFIVEIHSLTSCADINRSFKIRLHEINQECIQDVILKKGYHTRFVFDKTNIKRMTYVTIQVYFAHSKHNVSVHVPKLMELPCASYKWSVTNPIYINAVITAKQNEFMMSPQFSYGSCVWQIIFYPNTDGKVWLGLHLISMPSMIQKINIKCELFFKETNSVFCSDVLDFSQDNLKNKLSNDILSKIKNIKSLSIFAKICIYCIESDERVMNKFHIDDEIEAKDKDNGLWYKANIIDVQSDKIKVHWIGFGDEYDEYINICSDRLRFLGQCHYENFAETIIARDSKIESHATNNCELLDIKSNPTEYIWEICDIQTMKELKYAVNVFGFKSKMFTTHCLKWLLTIYPNGKSVEKEGFIDISLHLLSIPSEQLVVYTTYTIHLIEIDYQWTQTMTVNSTHNLINFPSQLCRDIIFDLKTLSIKVTIENVQICGSKHDDITHKFLNENHNKCRNIIGIKPETFSWNIGDRLLVNRMSEYCIESKCFKMYNEEWYLTVFPEKQCICLRKKIKTDESDLAFYVLCTLLIVEHKIKYVFNTKFTSESDVFEWNNNLQSKLENCNIQLEMQLIDVYRGSKNQTDDYIKCDKQENYYDEKLNKLTENVNIMADKLIEFTEKMNNMMNQMIIKKVNNGSNGIRNTDINVFRVWLNNTVNLGQYYSIFIKNGIDSLNTVKLIGINELNAMGIKLIGHQLKILHHIQILNQNGISHDRSI